MQNTYLQNCTEGGGFAKPKCVLGDCCEEVNRSLARFGRVNVIKKIRIRGPLDRVELDLESRSQGLDRQTLTKN